MMDANHSGSGHAVVNSALASVRAEPDERSEQVSQETLGAVLQVLERRGPWARCRGEDNYEGWVHGGALLFRAREAAGAWWDDVSGRPALALDALLVDDREQPLVRLPWGARVALLEGRDVRLPDGRAGRLAEGRLIDWDAANAAFPLSAAAVVATAAEWMGVPYVWGGRTRWGADCSGFVQAVHRVHGLVLPRDSGQQIEMGGPVDPAPGYDGLRPGDLLFFRAPAAERITHVAFSLGGAAILHAAAANGCVRENRLDGTLEMERSLAERVAGARRLCE